MKSSIMTQNLVRFNMFELLQKHLLKVYSCPNLRCKEHIWIKQAGNVKCARTQQNVNRSINTATRSRAPNCSISWPCISIKFWNILSYLPMIKKKDHVSSLHVPNSLGLGIHYQNHLKFTTKAVMKTRENSCLDVNYKCEGQKKKKSQCFGRFFPSFPPFFSL